MHKKEENWKYDESEKFKNIKSENIKIRDVLPEDVAEGGLAHMGDAALMRNSGKGVKTVIK